MVSEKHKFQDTMEITYEEYFRNQYSNVVKLIKELQEKIGEERTSEIVRPLFERILVDWTRGEAERNPINSLEDFVAYDERSFTRTHTHEVKEITSTKYRYHVTECVLADVLREMDASRIGYDILCAADFSCAKAYHPRLELTRTNTLMQGGKYCDFTYHWEE